MASSPYTVLIQRSMSADPISVQAPMPETFSMDAGASYEQPLPQGFTSSGTINAAFAAFGVRLAVQAMSAPAMVRQHRNEPEPRTPVPYGDRSSSGRAHTNREPAEADNAEHQQHHRPARKSGALYRLLESGCCNR